jgi:glutaredoxin|uniref:glutaredoxin family protein n=1 Tax=Candidatus Planktophila sp. TaxID=2175601 RepID=UPI00404A72C3
MELVTIYSRKECHLCEEALSILEKLKIELKFEITEIFIDGDENLEKLYGEQVPVTLINGEHHDYWRVDPERFKSSLEKHRQHQ